MSREFVPASKYDVELVAWAMRDCAKRTGKYVGSGGGWVYAMIGGHKHKVPIAQGWAWAGLHRLRVITNHVLTLPDNCRNREPFIRMVAAAVARDPNIMRHDFANHIDVA